MIIYYIACFLIRIVTKLVFRIRIYGQEHIPKEGGFILAPNHISYVDPPVVGSWIPRIVYFMGKKELFDNKLLGWYLHQVNTLPVKRGVMDMNAIKLCLKKIKDGYGLIIFPEGTRSKTDKFLEPKAGIGMIAYRSNCPIVPVYIQGFNRLSDCFWGKEKLTITIGEPISAEWIKSIKQGKEGYLVIAQKVIENLADLKENRIPIK